MKQITIILNEDGRFYSKLIKNDSKPEFNPSTDFANAYKWLEAKQGTIEFPNEDARRDV